MIMLRVGDYVKCAVENDEIEYGFVVSVNDKYAAYPYSVNHNIAIDDDGWNIGLYKESELTVVVNENIMNELIDNMVMI